MINNNLPGAKSPYYLKSGTGERYLFGGQIATILARPQDTGGLLEAAIIAGGMNDTFPLHQHTAAHETFMVIDGQLELSVNGKTYLLSRGDYANIPAGTLHGYRMRSHYTRMLVWTIGGDTAKIYSALGEPYSGFVPPSGPHAGCSAQVLAAAEAVADIKFNGQPMPTGATQLPDTLVPPASVAAYVIPCDEGERLIAGDQLFSFLATQLNTGGKFITLTTLGPKGDRIPDHFHEKHTETFFCLDGLMTMWANGEELQLHPGDFLHVPAGTIHTYRLDAPFTRFVGTLAPGLFEPFFRTMCDPYDAYIFPQTPKPVRFDRVIQRLHELDLRLVGGPPPR